MQRFPHSLIYLKIFTDINYMLETVWKTFTSFLFNYKYIKCCGITVMFSLNLQLQKNI